MIPLPQRKRTIMTIIAQKNLFSWESIETTLDLDCLSMVMKVISHTKKNRYGGLINGDH